MQSLRESESSDLYKTNKKTVLSEMELEKVKRYTRECGEHFREDGEDFLYRETKWWWLQQSWWGAEWKRWGRRNWFLTTELLKVCEMCEGKNSKWPRALEKPASPHHHELRCNFTSHHSYIRKPWTLHAEVSISHVCVCERERWATVLLVYVKCDSVCWTRTEFPAASWFSTQLCEISFKP